MSFHQRPSPEAGGPSRCQRSVSYPSIDGPCQSHKERPLGRPGHSTGGFHLDDRRGLCLPWRRQAERPLHSATPEGNGGCSTLLQSPIPPLYVGREESKGEDRNWKTEEDSSWSIHKGSGRTPPSRGHGR